MTACWCLPPRAQQRQNSSREVSFRRGEARLQRTIAADLPLSICLEKESRMCSAAAKKAVPKSSFPERSATYLQTRGSASFFTLCFERSRSSSVNRKPAILDYKSCTPRLSSHRRWCSASGCGGLRFHSLALFLLSML